jgi:hypothetical protein
MWYVISSGDHRYFFGGWILRPMPPRPRWVNWSRAAEKFHVQNDEELAELQGIAGQLGGELIKIPSPILMRQNSEI